MGKKATPLGDSPVQVTVGAGDIQYLWHTASESFLAKQPDRFELTYDPVAWKLTSADSLFWCDTFLEAKILRDFHRVNGREAALIVDLDDGCWVVLVRDFDLGLDNSTEACAARKERTDG